VILTINQGKSSDLVLGFHCFSFDVIMDFCYAKNWDTTRVPDFKSDIVFACQAVLPILTMRKYSGLLVKAMRYIPIWFGKKYGSVVTRSMFSLREVRNRHEARVIIDAFPSLLPQMYVNQIDEILRNPGSLENTPHKIIYHALLDPDANKGRALPSRLSLRQEAGALLNAGSDSTSISATTITYHVLRDPEVQQRLVKELRTAWPVLEEVPRYEVLEKLPYLASPHNRRSFSSNPKQLLQTAVIKEGLRMFPGGFTLPRVVPPEGTVIAGTFIPGGVSPSVYRPANSIAMLTRSQTVVGQCTLCVHRSPSVFSDPDAFIPDRWLGEDAKMLDASMVAFSKGPRNCIGINLAYCELYLVIAAIFRRFDMTLDAKRFVQDCTL
jgi:cytochrome P450